MSIAPRSLCIAAELSPIEAGGVETNLHSLISGLGQTKESGIDWKLLSPAGTLAPWLEEAGPRFTGVPWPHPIAGGVAHPHPVSRLRHWWTRRGFGRGPVEAEPFDRQLRDSGVEAIHFPYPTSFPTNLPMIYEPWDLQHRHFPEFFSAADLDYRERVYGGSCQRARVVVTATRFIKEDLIRQFGVDRERIAVVPRSSLQFQQRLTPEEKAAARAEHGLPERYLFYPAMTFRHKNHERLFEALVILRDRHGIRLPLICSGRPHKPYHPTVLKAAERLGVDGQVRFLGKVKGDLMCALFSTADLLVFPSLFEGLGLPVLEAFHHSLPVACSSTTCLPEVTDGAAQEFNPLDPESIASAVMTGLKDRVRREAMVLAGHRRLETFSWDAAIPQFVITYKRTLGHPLDHAEKKLAEAMFA
jgi:glycosyltransferase involved in cell wall biosynthesis